MIYRVAIIFHLVRFGLFWFGCVGLKCLCNVFVLNILQYCYLENKHQEEVS